MRISVFALAFLVWGCGDTKMKQIERLDELRILGAYTSTPEASPGASVSLQVLVSDIIGTAPTITGTYEACVDPGISRGAKVSCDHDPAKVSGSHTLDFSTLTPSTDFRTGLNSSTVNITIPNTILTGRGSRDQFNGVGYLVIFKFNEVTAYKRIMVTNRTGLNVNPSSADILSSSGSLSRAPLDGEELVATADAPEIFEFITIDGVTETRSEDQEVAWFVNQGEIDKPKSDIGDTVKYEGSYDGPFLLLVVIRDGRGGMTFVKKSYP